MIRRFFTKYKYYIIFALIILIAFTIFLILTSEGPQSGAFKYQIF